MICLYIYQIINVYVTKWFPFWTDLKFLVIEASYTFKKHKPIKLFSDVSMYGTILDYTSHGSSDQEMLIQGSDFRKICKILQEYKLNSC